MEKKLKKWNGEVKMAPLVDAESSSVETSSLTFHSQSFQFSSESLSSRTWSSSKTLQDVP